MNLNNKGGFCRILPCFFVMGLWVSCLALFSCQGDDPRSVGNGQDMDEMVRECSRAVSREEWHISDSVGKRLLDKAVADNSQKYIAYGRYYCGLFHVGLKPQELPGRLKLLESALESAQELKNDTLICLSFNGLAIWKMLNGNNYALASHYLDKALTLANEGGMEPYSLMIESNLSELYRLLQDTLGRKYDLAVYKRGKELGNASIATVAAYHCADYELRHDVDSAKVFEYVNYIKSANGRPWLSDILQGEYYLARGKYVRAHGYAVNALSNSGMSHDEKGTALMLYARILNKEGRYSESNKKAFKALECFSKQSFGTDWVGLYELISSNYSAMSRFEDAYDWKCRHQQAKDSIEHIINRESINRYKIEFDVEKKNKEIALHKERIKRYVTVGGVIFLAMIIVACLYYRHVSNRKQYYKNIVRQYKEALSREEVLRDRLSTALSENNSKSSDSEETDNDNEKVRNAERGGGQLSDQTVDKIFAKIMNEIENNEIYRDPAITRESFAALIGCNRTYFSEAVKRKTGHSYSQFMNDWRVHKAVEILSAPDNNISMKQLSEELGFLSQPTFFAAFKRVVGMTPAMYRKMYNMLDDKDVE